MQFIDTSRLFDGRYHLLRPLHMDDESGSDIWLAIDEQTADIPESDTSGEWKDKSGMYVAIKMYRPRHEWDSEAEQRFRDEFKIVYECRHANLLQPTSFSVFEGCPYLVLPYCRYGSCEHLVENRPPVSEVWKFISDVSSGLNRLHTFQPQIVHQDIKPSNILIDNSHNYVITDFGISSKRSGVHGYFQDGRNSGAYMAPERFLEEAVPMPQSDIWGFGATLFEILTGKTPFGEEGGRAQNEGGKQIPILPRVPASIRRLVTACLDRNPGKRPSARQLMDAARLQQYPVRRRLVPLLSGVSVAIVTAVLLLLFKPYPSQPLTLEDSFGKAMALIGSNDGAEFMHGYRIMDSLSNLGYIPAMYQMAYTHGWYTETESTRRKDMLGIKYDADEKIPVSDIDNQKAIAWLQTIMEKKDSAYASINAQAAYRLAGYYRNERVLNRDIEMTKKWVVTAREWAELARDTALVKRVDEWLSKVN